MKKIAKILSPVIAAAALVATAPVANAVSYEYDFSRPLPIEVTMPSGTISGFNTPQITITNDSDYKMNCYSLLGAPEKIEPVLNVYLYSENNDASADRRAADMITDAPNWFNDAGNSFIGPMNPRATYTRKTTFDGPWSGELAVFTKCSSLELRNYNSFYYTVVDSAGNEISELIPDVEAIRAEIEYVEPEPFEPEPFEPEPFEPASRSGGSSLSSR